MNYRADLTETESLVMLVGKLSRFEKKIEELEIFQNRRESL